MENLSRHDFIEEIRELVLSCSKLKKGTTNRKVTTLLTKYKSLIPHSTLVLESVYNERNNLLKVLNVIKSGKIEYKNGILLIKNIEEIKIQNNSVIVKTKYNREISFDKSFEYLTEIF